jgi:hypothetical protein
MSVDPANPTVLPTSVPPTTPIESDLDPDAMDDEDIAANQILEEKLIHDQQVDARPEDWNEPPTDARPEDWNEPPAPAAKDTPQADQASPLSDDLR